MAERQHHGCGHQNNCCCCETGPRVTGFLIPLILHNLLEAPSHGYQLIERLKTSSAIQDLPAPPVIYRHLRNLELDEMVTSTLEPGGGPPRKVYAITEEGKQCLRQWLHGLENLRDDLATFIETTKK